MAFLSEAELEIELIAQLYSLGYVTTSDDRIGPDGKHPERGAYEDTVLVGRLEAAVGRLNPNLPAEARRDAVRRVTQTELPDLLAENRRVHRLLVAGVDVEYYGEDGVLTGGQVRLLDFDIGPATRQIPSKWTIPKFFLNLFSKFNASRAIISCGVTVYFFGFRFRPKS